MKTLLIFASGTATGGGSGFERLCNDQGWEFQARITRVITNHPNGGVVQRARALGVDYQVFKGPFTDDNYHLLAAHAQPTLIVLTGWLKLVSGLGRYRVINEHPAPLPGYGGKGMYGHTLFEKLIADYKAGLIRESAISYHWVNERYDEGELIYSHPVPIMADDTPETLQERTKRFGHILYSKVISRILEGESCQHLAIPQAVLGRLI